MCISTAQTRTIKVVLARRSCGDPGDVLSKRSLHDLVQVLVRRSCGDPDRVLSKRSLHDLVQVLVRRSCGDTGEILSKRSLHDLAAATSYRCHRKFLYEDLVSSSI